MSAAPPRNKHLWLHGHFYQPPRESPWTEAFDPENSARPQRDWNARIAQECYGPNAASPLLGPDGRIAGMADNYEKLSFDFGPTLLNWLETERPGLYAQILRADAAGGGAIAQPYYHVILPLQSLGDKRALVRWGLEDFRRRFGRDSRGLWLPETAVDEETLEVLAEFGVEFTILAPWQAERVRPLGGSDSDWKRVEEKTLAPTRPYRWLSRRLPGRHVSVFFFHAGLHRSIVATGEAFARPDALFQKIFGRMRPDDAVELVGTAVDGEFFGHHHRTGATCLAQTILLAEQAGITVVHPGRYLDLFPPPEEVEIAPRTAWSCEHGLGRWTEDCGCRVDKRTRQHWRAPLRAAFDRLSGELTRVFEAKAGELFTDFRKARDAYAQRLTGWSQGTAERFIERECRVPLDKERQTMALTLLEMERHRLAGFTSCGWFFDRPDGLEARLCLSHAARAIELARSLGEELAPAFEESLGENAAAYRSLVLPQKADHERVAAHWALLNHLKPGLESCPPGWRIEAGDAVRREKKLTAGRRRSVSARRMRVKSLATLETRELTAVVHQKDRLDVACRITWSELDVTQLFARFDARDDAGFESALNEAQSARFLSLDALLPEDRAEVLRWLAPDPSGGAARRKRLDAWTTAMAELRSGVGGEACLDLLEEARQAKEPLDRLPWAFVARKRLTEILESLLDGADEPALARASRWLEAFEAAGFAVDVWELQHLYWRWRALLSERSGAGAERRLAAALGEKLGFSDSALPLEAPAR